MVTNTMSESSKFIKHIKHIIIISKGQDTSVLRTGSKSAYLLVLLTKLCAVPKNTAKLKRVGLSSNPMRMQAKNGAARSAISAGVAHAPTRHPNNRIKWTPKKITMHVLRPTAELKFPMKR